MTKLLEHLKFDNLSKNESVNFEMVKPIGFFNEDNGTFIRNGKTLLKDARWNNWTRTRTNSYQISIIQLNKGKTGDWTNHFSPEFNRRIHAGLNQTWQKLIWDSKWSLNSKIKRKLSYCYFFFNFFMHFYEIYWHILGRQILIG